MATGHDVHYGTAVYGSVLVATVAGALLHTDESAGQLTLTLAGSMVIFWLAHVWSETLGERVAGGRRFDTDRIRHIGRAEWPLVEAGLVPTLLLALAWIGPWSGHTGIKLALAAAVVQLVAWGFTAAYRTGRDWHGAVFVGAGDGVLGIAIVALELAVH